MVSFLVDVTSHIVIDVAKFVANCLSAAIVHTERQTADSFPILNFQIH